MTRARFATMLARRQTALADQDALNALLMSEFEPADLALQPDGRGLARTAGAGRDRSR